VCVARLSIGGSIVLCIQHAGADKQHPGITPYRIPDWAKGIHEQLKMLIKSPSTRRANNGQKYQKTSYMTTPKDKFVTTWFQSSTADEQVQTMAIRCPPILADHVTDKPGNTSQQTPDSCPARPPSLLTTLYHSLQHPH
jgi:hypothetical protein